MRAPGRRRPKRREMHAPPSVDLDLLASRARYVSSPDHRDFPSFAGPTRLRADASNCPRHITDVGLVSGWPRSAIRRGATSAYMENGFPRYVRHLEGGTVFEVRLVNRGDGSYKGYPIGEDEWPPGIREKHV